MHDAFWEAIHVEHLLKRYHLRKAKLQEGKSPETTKVKCCGINYQECQD